MLDPEALLLATTSLGRDPRLFDEVLDWLNTNGQFINLQRLQNLGQRFGDLTVLRPMAAYLAGRSVHAKWKTLLREKPTVSEAQPLFPGVPVFGSPDELFARHGWQRGPVTLRRLSQPADPHRPTNFLIKLRACLETLDSAFLCENIHILPGATGAAYVEAVLGDLLRILK